VPGNGDSREHKSEEADGRDGEEDMHAFFMKNNKVCRFVQLIRSMLVVGSAGACECFAETRRYEIGTSLRERGFPP
jgi:hypothetical protein